MIDDFFQFSRIFFSGKQRVAGDCDQLIFSCSKFSIYFMSERLEDEKPNCLASRIAIDAGILDPPLPGNGKFFESNLPSRGILYVLQGRNHISLDHQILLRNYNQIFKPNVTWLSLKSRYRTLNQAVGEYNRQHRETKKLFEMLQHRLFNRVTAFTLEQVCIQYCGVFCSFLFADFKLIHRVIHGSLKHNKHSQKRRKKC